MFLNNHKIIAIKLSDESYGEDRKIVNSMKQELRLL